jgi:hypothetical protein
MDQVCIMKQNKNVEYKKKLYISNECEIIVGSFTDYPLRFIASIKKLQMGPIL